MYDEINNTICLGKKTVCTSCLKSFAFFLVRCVFLLINDDGSKEGFTLVVAASVGGDPVHLVVVCRRRCCRCLWVVLRAVMQRGVVPFWGSVVVVVVKKGR